MLWQIALFRLRATRIFKLESRAAISKTDLLAFLWRTVIVSSAEVSLHKRKGNYVVRSFETISNNFIVSLLQSSCNLKSRVALELKTAKCLLRSFSTKSFHSSFNFRPSFSQLMSLQLFRWIQAGATSAQKWFNSTRVPGLYF